MLNIPDTIKSLFERDDIHKNFRVHFPNGEFPDITNENIVEESVKFTESFCSQNNFRFGLAESSVLEFETVGAGNMFGMTIDASMEIDTSTLTAAELDEIEAGSYDGELIRAGASDLGFGVYRVPYGRFFVESCPRNHQAMAHRNVVAYSVAQIDKYNMGQNPASKITFDIATIREIFENDMTGYVALPERTISKRNYLIATKDTSTTPQGLYFGNAKPMIGVDGAGMYYKEFSYDRDGLADQTNIEYVIDVDYKWDYTLDGQSGKFMEELTTIAPSGFNYTDRLSPNYGSTAKAINYALNLFAPSYYIAYTIRNRSTGASKTGRTMPKPIPKPGKYPVCFRNELDAVTGKQIALSANEYIGRTVTRVIVPYFVAGDRTLAKIERTEYSGGQEYFAESFYPENWPITEEHYRDEWETINVKVKQMTLQNVPLTYVSDLKSTMIGLPDYYDFTETIDAEVFKNADYELNGNFGKIKRTTGKFERASLDASDPVEISPANYSELWWDEYDIAKIGNVYINSEKLGGAVVSIGSGQSYYDMSDNKIIADLADATSMPGIAETILNEFAPATENCYFTPAEITLHGAPWIEAGDALRITAEDETTVETFALRHTISGIQNLVSAIEATSGRIIGVEA